MPINYIENLLFALLLMIAGNGFAQKNIIISESLAANSKPLKVKMGTQWAGKIWKLINNRITEGINFDLICTQQHHVGITTK